MESDGDFETSPTSNHSDPKLKIVSKSQDSNANDGALKDSRRRFNVAKKQMADGFSCLVKRTCTLMVISWVCHFAQIRR